MQLIWINLPFILRLNFLAFDFHRNIYVLINIGSILINIGFILINIGFMNLLRRVDNNFINIH